MIREFKTRTGAIFCDTERMMEYLYVGDYGKENNIKADFLGYTREINAVQHKEVDLAEKLVVTISTQKGCPMNCQFCDCPRVPFGGNLTREDLVTEVKEAIAATLPMPKGRKYTLNFPVTGETILDPRRLSSLFNKDKFIVKLTPIHETAAARANGITTPGGYSDYDVYRRFEEPLLAEGWQVIVFVPSKEEDEDRITCGNALLAALSAQQ